MPTRIVDVQFPLAGLNRANAFSKQQEAPYTTYDAENVRPRDRELDRLTGGSRPGLSMYSDTTNASVSPVQMLKTVSVKKEDDFSVWEDTFDYSAMSHYSTIPNLASTALPTISNGMATAPASTTTTVSFMVPTPTGLDADSPLCISVFNVTDPQATGSLQHNINIYFGMAGNGDEDNCYYLECLRPSDTSGWGFTLYKVTAGTRGSVLASGSYAEIKPVDGWIDVELNGTSFVAYYRGTQVASATLSVAVSSSVPRVGVGLKTNSATASHPVQISRVSLQYYTTSPRDSARRRLVTAIGGVMRRESFRGRLTASTSPMQINSTGLVEATESGQRLFIADNPALIAQGTDGEFSSSGTVFDSDSVSDWTALITNARRGDYYLQVDPLPRPITTAIATSYVFSGDDLQATKFTDGMYGKNPSITIYVTNGTLSLSTVSGLVFVAGDGTDDATMGFYSNAATPELRWAAIAAALTNATYTSTATNNIYAELSLSITGAYQSRVDTVKVKKQIDSSDTSQTQELLEFTTNFEIDAVASGNLTVTGGPAATTTGLTWRLLRCPKVYDPLADEEAAVASGTDGVITSSSIFDSATYTAWATTLAGKDLSKYAVQILSGSTITAEYPIVGFNSSNIAGDTDHLLIGPATNATGLTFQIARRDKLIRWTARRGEVPVGCSIIARYQDRLVLAGNARSPQNWYMSRMGDPHDFQYSDVDVGAAVMGINSQAGVIGEPITALIPYNDDNFFFGGRSSLWLLRGNPAGGGRIDNVSYVIGVLSSTSWCHGPLGEVIWLSRDGIYYTSPQCLSCEPIPMSRDKLPREFLDINPDMYYISMAYDVRARGVHIFITPKTTGTSSSLPAGVRHWFIHWETKSFWPVSFANKAHNPILACTFTAPSPEDSGVLVAGYDGDIFRFSRSTSRDNLTDMTSYVNFGPLPIVNSPYHRGIIRTIDVVMGETSADTTWSLYEGDTAESVATATTAFQTGTFTEGAQTTIAPLMGGSNWRMKISSTGPWAFSSATAVISQLGKDRSYA